MNGEDFKHLYPIETEKQKTIHPKSRIKSKQINMTNIGQIIFICFLFIFLSVQIAKMSADSNNSVDSDAYIQDNNSQNANNKTAVTQSVNEKINKDTDINDRNNLNINNTENADSLNSNDSIDSDNPETIFILGESGGKLAVLSPDRQTVYETFNVYINTLPDYDKDLLQTGINIKTPEQLYSLLEDYNS